jgi:glycerol-3-phosphate dehydrogenase (NAD(P)+)
MIGVVGAGAFGTALAVALARDGRDVMLWARDPALVAHMARTRQNAGRLADVELPETVSVTAEIADLCHSDAVLLTLPMQALSGFLTGPGQVLNGLPMVACCKGVDLATLAGPSAVIAAASPASQMAVLTGPSFAADIGRGMPTALTLACADTGTGHALQHLISTPVLRIYLSQDVIGAELGGALKNVIAIAAGVVMGAGLGESARAALITRGYAEMGPLALRLGAQPDTLAGLSGFGDLVLTCTSPQSRNFRFGMALAHGASLDPNTTVEGAATARAVARLGQNLGLDLPITTMVAALIDGTVDLPHAIQALLSRPLKQE